MCIGRIGSMTATGGNRVNSSDAGKVSPKSLERHSMKPLQRVAFIGNHLPRRCGIATFTHDLHHAVASDRLDLATSVVAMTDPGQVYAYPPVVQAEVRDDEIAEYARAAAFLNDTKCDVVSLLYEYGIFGGEAGDKITVL